MTAIVILLFSTLGGCAGAAQREQKDVPENKFIDPAKIVRGIDLAGYSTENPRIHFGVPIEIARAEEIAKHIPDKTWIDKIAKQVDFDRERLLYFRWFSYEGDKLRHRISLHSQTKKPIVAFWRVQGDPSKDIGTYYHLFAVARSADWQILDQPAEKDRSTVRAFDLTEFTGKQPTGLPDEPLVIRSAAELAKAMPDQTHWHTEIQRQVDFAHERLLFFQWSGSGEDRLWFELPEAKRVKFAYSPGKTANDAPHFHLFAVANEAAWRVEQVGGNEQPPVRLAPLADLTLFHDDTDPLLIDSLDAARRAFRDAATVKRIAADIDFAKQRLLYFYWEGSGQDVLTPLVAMSRNKKNVRFAYHPGQTTDLRTHYKLYAVNRDVEYAGSGLFRRGGSFTRIYEVHAGVDPSTIGAGAFRKPTLITSENDLLKQLGDKDAVAEIRRAYAIDFKSQKLLLFCFDAKAGTDLGHVVRAEYKDAGWKLLSSVTFFQPRMGNEGPANRHLRLFAMPKDADYEVLPSGARPFATGPP